MRVLICSYSDTEGGAARAAFKHFQALLAFGVDAEFWSAKYRFNKNGIYDKTSSISVIINFVKRQISRLIIRSFSTNNGKFKSLGLFSAISIRDINQSDFDVINLHWVCGELLSVGDIAKISKPIVWTLHDMWAFLGIEHYQGSEIAESPCQDGKDPYINGDSSRLEKWAWLRKIKLWHKPIYLVLSSRWMLAKMQASSIVGEWESSIIPNAINLDFYREIEMEHARQKFNLPLDKKIVLFGAAGGLGDARKGGDLLLNSMKVIVSQVPDVCLVVFGGANNLPIDTPDNSFKIINLGPITDENLLPPLYSTANVLVIPSREDNLPLIAVEAHACSCPIVAFDIAGLKDIVESGVTGFLTPPFDTEQLGYAISHILLFSEPEMRQMRNDCRIRAEKLWSTDAVVPLYLATYNNAIEASSRIHNFHTRTNLKS
jgi:glycosyltransferase involved in cell wall biosynthesis